MIENFRNQIIAGVAIDHPTKVTKTIAMPRDQMEAKFEEVAELEKSLRNHYGDGRVDVRINKGYGAGMHQLIVVVFPENII